MKQGGNSLQMRWQGLGRSFRRDKFIPLELIIIGPDWWSIMTGINLADVHSTNLSTQLNSKFLLLTHRKLGISSQLRFVKTALNSLLDLRINSSQSYLESFHEHFQQCANRVGLSMALQSLFPSFRIHEQFKRSY